MVTMLNSFILPEDIVQKMKDKIAETRDKEIELGFSLCRTKSNIIRTGDDCTGTECKLESLKECRIGSYIGGYHTHPKGTTKPSITDLATAYNIGVECIGSVKEDDIKCIVRIGNVILQVKEDILEARKNDETLGTTLTKEEFQKWKYTRDNILDKYFKITDIK